LKIFKPDEQLGHLRFRVEETSDLAKKEKTPKKTLCYRRKNENNKKNLWKLWSDSCAGGGCGATGSFRDIETGR